MARRLLRRFDTIDDYNDEKCSLEVYTISHINEDKSTKYGGGSDSYFIATYNVTSITSKTILLGFSSTDMKQISKMYIDDVEVTPTSAYTFTTLGEHIVKCEFCNLSSCYKMFNNCYGLTSVDLSNFNTSKVTNMNYMFSSCSGLTSLDLSSFDTSKVTNMISMFNSCSGLTSVDLSNFNTSNVTTMRYMFTICKGLTSVDLSSFDTSKVTSMSDMFSYCSGLTSLDVSSFNTSNVTNMSNIFSSCSSLTSLTMLGDISKVTSYSSMFYNITTTGTLTYNCAYEDAWTNILVTKQSTSKFPSTWTKTCVTV